MLLSSINSEEGEGDGAGEGQGQGLGEGEDLWLDNSVYVG